MTTTWIVTKKVPNKINKYSGNLPVAAQAPDPYTIPDKKFQQVPGT
jgi:hypothetical protein